MSQGSVESERRIGDLKRQIDDLWLKRYSAAASGDEGKLWEARFKLGETTLMNCSAIADNIRRVSGSVANEIDEKIQMAAQGLSKTKRTRSLDTLHAWYKNELAPLLNKVEQEEHLISVVMRKEENHLDESEFRLRTSKTKKKRVVGKYKPSRHSR